MDTHIKEVLFQIEREYEVKILYACESGSRTWGLASKNSDYDVRFLYIHKLDWYLSIDSYRDVIELPNHDSLSIPIHPSIDMSGWELTKALRLFRKSNPPMLEWLQSNIIYYQSYSTINKMRSLENEIFSSTALIHHYVNMAKRNLKNYLLEQNVKIKNYFNVLRPILSAKWVQTYQTIPPVQFDRLMSTLVPKSPLREDILELVHQKQSGRELETVPQVKTIHYFLEQEINEIELYVKTLSKQQTDPTPLLNNIFRETLFEVWN